MKHSVAIMLGLLSLGACTPAQPLVIERGGTLSAATYATFEAQAAAAKPVTSMAARPEPKWVFAFDQPVDPRVAPLQIGLFTGSGDIGRRVASNLPAALVDTLKGAQLFPEVSTAPTPHGFVLAGRVTRADTEDTGLMEMDAGTQVEATLSRDGRTLGAIQVNAVQLSVSAVSLLPSLIMSAAQGTRVSFVSERFSEVFDALAKGARHGISTGGISRRFMSAPTLDTGIVTDAPAKPAGTTTAAGKPSS